MTVRRAGIGGQRTPRRARGRPRGGPGRRREARRGDRRAGHGGPARGHRRLRDHPRSEQPTGAHPRRRGRAPGEGGRRVARRGRSRACGTCAGCSWTTATSSSTSSTRRHGRTTTSSISGATRPGGSANGARARRRGWRTEGPGRSGGPIERERGRRTAAGRPPPPGRRWRRGPPRAGPSSSNVTPVTPGRAAAVNTIWATAWIWAWPTSWPKVPPRLTVATPPAPMAAPSTRRLRRDGALEPRRRLGVGRARTRPRARSARPGAETGHVAGHGHQMAVGLDQEDLHRGPRRGRAVVVVVAARDGCRRPKGMPWRDRADGARSTGTPHPARARHGQRRRARTRRTRSSGSRPVRGVTARRGPARPSGLRRGRASPTARRGLVGSSTTNRFSPPDAALDPDAPAVEPDVLGHERQPQPGPVRRPPPARGLAPVEALEDAFALGAAPPRGRGRPPPGARRRGPGSDSQRG